MACLRRYWHLLAWALVPHIICSVAGAVQEAPSFELIGARGSHIIDCDGLHEIAIGQHIRVHALIRQNVVDKHIQRVHSSFSRSAVASIEKRGAIKDYKSGDLDFPTFVDSMKMISVTCGDNNTIDALLMVQGRTSHVRVGSHGLSITDEAENEPIDGTTSRTSFRRLEGEKIDVVKKWGGKLLDELPETEVYQWENCYPYDTIPHELSIGIAITSKFYARFGYDDTATINYINSVVAQSNVIFMTQMNILLTVGDLYVSTIANVTDPDPPWNDPSCDLSVGEKLQRFQDWEQPSKRGYWMMLDDCFNGAITGYAQLGTLCQMDRTGNGYINVGISEYGEGDLMDLTYRTFAHETGHIFGAWHPWDKGQGAPFVTGGIMDYGGGAYHCAVQFTPNKQKEMCPVLTAVVPTCEAFWTLTETREEILVTLPDPETPLTSMNSLWQCSFYGLALWAWLLCFIGLLCVCCCCLWCVCCVLKSCCCPDGLCASRRSRSGALDSDDEDGEDDEL